MKLSTKYELFLKFKNINLSGLTFKNDNGYLLSFRECNLTGCEFENCSREKLEIISCIFDDFIKTFGKIKKLENLTLGGEKVDISKIEELKEINSIKLVNMQIEKEIMLKLSNTPNIHILNIEDCDIEDIELLEKFNQLEELNIDGINGVQNYLPKNSQLKRLSLNNCDISDIKFLEELKWVQEVNLDDNNLSENNLEELKNLSDRVKSLSFERNPITNLLKTETITIKNQDVKAEIKKMLGRPLSKYDLLTRGNQYFLTVKDEKMLDLMLENGLEEYLKRNNININIKSFKKISPKTLDYLKNAGKVILNIECFNGISPQILDDLETNSEIEYKVENDLYASEYYYTSKDMQEILQVMEKMKNSIPRGSNELKKFLSIYKAIGLSAYYDESGCIKHEDYVQGMEKTVRSLKGVLIQGKAVCSGYALALARCLEYIGIETKIISNGEHAWNQVKIDGEWYNVDLTWDYEDIVENNELKYCLKGDEEFSKTHIVQEEKVVEKCKKDYSKRKIEKTLKALRTKNDAHKEIFGKGYNKLVEMQDYKNNAKSTIISSEIIKKIKQFIDKKIKREKNQPEQNR